MSAAIVSGFVDVDDGLRRFEIRAAGTDGFSVWIDGELADEHESVCDFLEEAGGVYWTSKAAYKRDETLDLSLAVLRHVLATRRSA